MDKNRFGHRLRPGPFGELNAGFQRGRFSFSDYFKPTNKSTTNRQQIEVECGPMPNVMVALPNIGGALCSTPQFG